MNNVIATNRFGLGALPGEIETASADPAKHVLAQLTPISFQSSDSSHSIASTLQRFRKDASEEFKKKAQKFGQATYRRLSA